MLSRKFFILAIALPVLWFVASCSETDKPLPILDEIKELGNVDPRAALSRLDSISISMSGESRHNIMRFELLKLRLHEKAEIMPESYVKGKDIYTYFMDKGNDCEKQEACYYLASIYRDLHDSPRAIRYFQEALEIAESSATIDSVTVANTYSQLSALYRMQYDYNAALDMAEKGLTVAEKLDVADPIYIMDVATIAYALNDTAKTLSIQQKALDIIQRENTENLYPDVLCEILSILSHYQRTEEAKACKTMVERIQEENIPHNYFSSLADYYLVTETLDSAIYYNQMQRNAENTTLEGQFNAALNLAQLYNRIGDPGNALRYALEFMELQDNYKNVLQHDLAVNAHNEYVYNRDKAEEERILREAEDAKSRKAYWALAFILLLALSVSLIIVQRYRSLKRMNQDLIVINRIETELKNNNSIIEEKESLISEQRQKIDNTQKELDSLSAELSRKENEVAVKDNELQSRIKVLREKESELEKIESVLFEKEKILIEKIEQNEKLFGFAFTENIRKTSDITLKKFNDAAVGKRALTEREWKELFTIIERLYPDFRKSVMQKIKKPSIDKLRIAYLLKTGMTKPQIVSLTNYPNTTVWRKVKYLTEVLGEDLYSFHLN